ncbi:hypothetical protein MKY20_20145 [Cytobacillus sp. FSL W8-0315]|uniref:hypothetical protein n=1 Tax=Cytobacillus sp. FSL W8-0315 TaxID=2921600 RepID=UPI0030F841C0
MDCQVFFFNDGENHWIAAESEMQAKQYFEKDYSDYDSSEDYDFHICKEEELNREFINNSEDQKSNKKYVSLNDILQECKNENLPRVIASSVY